LKRRKGRPSTKKDEATPVTGYEGPSLDDIMQMSDQQVQASFNEIEVEPKPFIWSEDDDLLNVALWHDFGMMMTDAERVKTQPKNNAEMKLLKASASAIHQECLRPALLSAHVQQWIDGLDDSQLIEQIEHLAGVTLSESEVRYAKVSDLKQRVFDLTWPTLIAASTLYVCPNNPLEGGKK